MRVGVFLLVLLMAAPALAAGRDCVGPYSFDDTESVPSESGVRVNDLDGLMASAVDVTAGSITATLQTLVGGSWVSLGTYTGDGKLKFEGPDDFVRLTIDTCSSCAGTWTLCGRTGP